MDDNRCQAAASTGTLSPALSHNSMGEGAEAAHAILVVAGVEAVAEVVAEEVE
jgi:hypothetical protein